MKTIITSAFSLSLTAVLACSGYTQPFCAVHAQRPNDAVISGVITAMGGHSLQLNVIDILWGSDSRSVITVWDGKDFDCNGIVPMNVATMGQVGDTILAILPLITTTVNTWDVVGDYSRPQHLFTQSVLKIQNDTVRGPINGSTTTAQPHWFVSNIKYSDFKAYWQQHQADCTQLVAINKVETRNIALIHAIEGGLFVRSAHRGPVQVSITSLTGSKVGEFEGMGDLTINMDQYARGMYVVTVSDDKGRSFRQKVLH